MLRIRRRGLALLLAALFVLGVRPVLAHGYIIRSIPEDRTVLEHSPTRIQYWFSEALEKQFSTLSVRDQVGNIIATGGVSDTNPSLLATRLPNHLPDGAYVVDMRLAFASDGHVVAQSVVFFVGKTVNGVAGNAASNSANPLEVIWRTFSLASTLLLLGTFVLYTFILVPAWGNPAHRAGLLPPRVMKRLNAIVIGALMVSFASGALALLQQTMVFFNADAGQVISQGLWSVVRIGSRFGDLWTARTFLLGLVAALITLSLFFRDDQPETVRPTWTACIWAMVLVMGTFSAGSHASGSVILPWFTLANDWLHTLAVGVWAGGLGALVLVLPVALAPYEGDSRRLALLAVLQRFSRMAVICVALVVVTGLYSAANGLNQPADVTQTPYGGALVLKLALVAGLLLIGLTHHMALRPEHYQRWTESINRFVHPGGRTAFLGTLRLEVMFALMVLGSAGLLSATPPPIPPNSRAAVPSPTASQTIGDLLINVTLSPGGPGVNTYDVTATRDGQPVDGLDVHMQWVNPESDRRSAWETVDNADSGLYIASGAEIDRAGQWWSLLDIRGADGNSRRAAMNWQISPDAAVQESQPPRLQHILALVGVVAVLGWISYPYARRFYAMLDLRPASVTVAVSAIAAMILFVTVSIVVVQNTQAQVEATLNPPPKMVNTVLPVEASLERGGTLYNDHCPAWQTRNLNSFVERLPHLRDDQLFEAIQGGWQDLPACDSGLSDPQRWDIVNYVRTFEKP
jgi:copper transport protein